MISALRAAKQITQYTAMPMQTVGEPADMGVTASAI